MPARSRNHTRSQSGEPRALALQIEKELRQNIDARYRETVLTHFAVQDNGFLGVRNARVRKIGRAHYAQLRDRGIDEILPFSDALLETGLYEPKIIAFQWAFAVREQTRIGHFPHFQRWLRRHVADWPECDDLCTHSLGDLLHRYPKLAPRVEPWTRSRNRWLRRASAIAWIYAVRRGEALPRIFKTARSLLRDPDDLVQKGYGWTLKEASKLYPDEVYEFVLRHKARMPRTALRYAIEKLSPSRRRVAMRRD